MQETLLDMLKRHEGLRLFPYKCTAGKTTIGFGRNLTNVGISEEEAIGMLVHDMETALKEVYGFFPNIYGYSADRRAALVDMVFNLGLTSFRTFVKMIEAIREENWERAAAEAKDSEWYRQVGSRGEEVVQMLLNG